MTALLDLAARVEAAEGPDRELDGSIWWAVRTPDEIAIYDRTGYVRECIERDGSAGKALAQFYDSANPSCLAKIAFQRAYTASLDAAMTLVPEGWAYRVDWRPEGLDLPRGADTAPALGMVYRGLGQAHVTNATTPALALCAAALRARGS